MCLRWLLMIFEAWLHDYSVSRFLLFNYLLDFSVLLKGKNKQKKEKKMHFSLFSFLMVQPL